GKAPDALENVPLYFSVVFQCRAKDLALQSTVANTYSCKALHSNRKGQKLVVSHELTAKYAPTPRRLTPACCPQRGLFCLGTARRQKHAPTPRRLTPACNA